LLAALAFLAAAVPGGRPAFHGLAAAFAVPGPGCLREGAAPPAGRRPAAQPSP
jgi:hypothetical protein